MPHLNVHKFDVHMFKWGMLNTCLNEACWTVIWLMGTCDMIDSYVSYVKWGVKWGMSHVLNEALNEALNGACFKC